jgi:hypothetical protein
MEFKIFKIVKICLMMGKIKFLARKFCIKINLQLLFQSLNTFMRKGKVPDPDADPGGPKTYGFRSSGILNISLHIRIH